MALIGTLVDNFNDGTLTGYATFGYGGGAVAETGGRLNVSAVNGAASETEVRTTATYDLTESAVYLEVPQALTAKTGSETQIWVRLDDSNKAGIVVANTTFQAFRRVAGSTTFHGQRTYANATHRWWRLRHTGGTLYWEFSADGATWTLLHSAAPGFAITAVSFSMVAGTWQAETGAGTALFDNLNTTGGTTQQGAAALTGAATTAAAGRLIGRAGAALTASATATIDARATMRGEAALAASATTAAAGRAIAREAAALAASATVAVEARAWAGPPRWRRAPPWPPPAPRYPPRRSRTRDPPRWPPPPR